MKKRIQLDNKFRNVLKDRLEKQIYFFTKYEVGILLMDKLVNQIWHQLEYNIWRCLLHDLSQTNS